MSKHPTTGFIGRCAHLDWEQIDSNDDRFPAEANGLGGVAHSPREATMALSENEQRLLDQLEAALAAEDPKLASTLRGTTYRRLHRRRAAIAGFGFLVGLAGLIAGMQWHPVVSVIGFVIMLASTVIALTSWQHVGDAPPKSAPNRQRAGSTDSRFMDRMEERWRRRQDDGM